MTSTTLSNSPPLLHSPSLHPPQSPISDDPSSFAHPLDFPHNIDQTELLSVSWNQDYGCFAAATSLGFRIYNSQPFEETFRRDLKSGGFKIVEMLFRCNIFALVGGDSNSHYPSNKVIIWDDHQSRCIGEFAFRSDVRAVKLRRDRIVVVLEHKIYVYSFMDLKLLHQIETLANPRGLCCLSHHSNTSVLACPGLHRGQVRVEHFGLNMMKLINAHDSHIACFTLTFDGLLLATASTRGTLIRIFNTMDGTRLQEGFYQNILARNGHLLSFTYLKIPNSLQHLDLKTLLLLSAWMGVSTGVVLILWMEERCCSRNMSDF
ncbi:hypothetical protein REPUB_Repub13aG0114300 [Reevesia pubescens]